jgi:hypothetical protein
VTLTISRTTAGCITNDLVQIITAQSPLWPPLSVLTDLFLEKFWMFLVISLLETIVRNLTMSKAATKYK